MKSVHEHALEFAAKRSTRLWDVKAEYRVPMPETAPHLYDPAYSVLAEHEDRPVDAAAFARVEILHLLSHYYYGEAFAVAAVKRALEDPELAAAWGPSLEALLADEVQHADALRLYLEERVGGLQPQAEPMAAMARASLAHPDSRIPLLTLHLVVEAFGLGSISASRRGLEDPALLELLAQISADEAHHLALGKVFAESLSSTRSEHYVAWVAAATAAMRASCIPEGAFVEAYPDHSRRAAAISAALKSVATKRQARFVGGTMMRNMKDLTWSLGATEARWETLFLGTYDPSQWTRLTDAFVKDLQ